MKPHLMVRLMSRGKLPGMPGFDRAYAEEESRLRERRNADRAWAIWSALSPHRRMQDAEPDGMVRFGTWTADQARAHPALRDLVARHLRREDKSVMVWWRQGSDELEFTISDISEKSRVVTTRM